MRALLASALAAVWLSACGGLENQPLTHGVVRGQLAETQPGLSVVAVMGQPSLRVAPSASGAFEIADLPQGHYELFVLATDLRAARVPAVVGGGTVADLGTISSPPGAFLEMHVTTSGQQLLGAGEVEVEGTPLQPAGLDDEGNTHVGPLPAGCYDVSSLVPGFGGAQKQNVCVSEGEDLEVDVQLPDTDGSDGLEGCLVAGCPGGYSCQPDGTCE